MIQSDAFGLNFWRKKITGTFHYITSANLCIQILGDFVIYVFKVIIHETVSNDANDILTATFLKIIKFKS